ncbi:hypothetical protein PIB30_042855 [Stylosanthes scabra]|uniref:Cystatin domain-containing protein n=1 Tax=Stylosanthes scabra TaxID=79078 RepID=A0ABU6YG20_9FABA|nr:hypothetical protein [Stylosanthes scabra]
MTHVGDKRGRNVDDKLNYMATVTSFDESDNDDYDSDVYVSSPRKPTKEEISEYYRHCLVSKGFDVPTETGDETSEQLVTDLAKQALQVYNQQNNESFEFDHIVKANSQVVAGYMFYITFTARSGDNASQTFHGKEGIFVILKIWGKMVILSCSRIRILEDSHYANLGHQEDQEFVSRENALT